MLANLIRNYHLLRNSDVCCSRYKNPPLVPKPSQFSPVHIFTRSIYCTLICCQVCHKCKFISCFPTQFIILELITPKLSSETWKLWNCWHYVLFNYFLVYIRLMYCVPIVRNMLSRNSVIRSTETKRRNFVAIIATVASPEGKGLNPVTRLGQQENFRFLSCWIYNASRALAQILWLVRPIHRGKGVTVSSFLYEAYIRYMEYCSRNIQLLFDHRTFYETFFVLIHGNCDELEELFVNHP